MWLSTSIMGNLLLPFQEKKYFSENTHQADSFLKIKMECLCFYFYLMAFIGFK